MGRKGACTEIEEDGEKSLSKQKSTTDGPWAEFSGASEASPHNTFIYSSAILCCHFYSQHSISLNNLKYLLLLK